MKTIFIAAGVIAAIFGTAPIAAAPAAAQQRNGQTNTNRDMRDNDQMRGNRDTDRSDRSGSDWNRSDRNRSDWNRSDRRGRDWNRSDRRGRDWNNGWRGNHYGWRNRCHMVRRHHRWVRDCRR